MNFFFPLLFIIPIKILNFIFFFFKSVIVVFSFLGIFYSIFIIISELDIKRIIAYSSVIHMSFSCFTLFCVNEYGIIGFFFSNFSHGFASPALFFLVGIIYAQFGSRNIKDYSGLIQQMPFFVLFFFFAFLANISFPGTFNFFGELLSFIGILFDFNIIYFKFDIYYIIFFISILGLLMLFFGAIFNIWTFVRICFGQFFFPIYKKLKKNIYDLNKIQIYGIIFLIIHCIFFGFNLNLYKLGLIIDIHAFNISYGSKIFNSTIIFENINKKYI